MSSKMTVMFEPADLFHASPATVSRCGMVYMEPGELGWRPLRDAYLKKLPPSVGKDQRSHLRDLSDWLVPATLTFLDSHCDQFIYTSHLHLVAVGTHNHSSPNTSFFTDSDCLNLNLFFQHDNLILKIQARPNVLS